MKKSLLTFFLPIVLFSGNLYSEEQDKKAEAMKKSLLQLRITQQKPNFLTPWQFRSPRVIGAVGIVTQNKRILTLASYVADSSVIELKKYSSYNSYRAYIEKIDFESNLALLKTDDDEFFSDLEGISFPDKVPPSKNITFIQLDNSGMIQTAKGRTNGLDLETLITGHTELPYLIVNTTEKMDGYGELITYNDKPIGILGEFAPGKNSGKGIPGFLINSFLRCVLPKDANSCVPYKGFRFRQITDLSTREYYKVPKGMGGVIIAEVIPHSGAEGTLKAEDVVLEFGGKQIDSKGYFIHPEYGKQSLSYLAHSGGEWGLTLGKKIPVKVLRSGKLLDLEYTLRPFPQKALRIPYANLNGKKPPFLIQAGFVFVEFSEFFLREWGNNWRSRVDKKLLYLNDFHKIHKAGDSGRIVLLYGVLPDEVNKGYHNLNIKIVESANGKPVRSIAELANLLKKGDNRHNLIALDGGYEIAIDKQTLNEADQRIATTYRIPKLGYYEVEP